MSTVEGIAESRTRGRWSELASSDHGLSAMLVILLIIVFVIHPLGEIGITGRVVASVVFSLMLMSGVWTVAGRPVPAIIVGVVVLAGITVRWLRLWLGGGSLLLSSAIVGHVFCIVVAGVVLAQVFREGRITFHRIQGAIAVYLLLGMAWAFAYQVVALEWPDAFVVAHASDSMDGLVSPFVYFSFVTLTTVGFGDVTAIHPIARSLVIMEALIGQLFPAVLLARLVSLQVVHSSAAPDEREP